VDLTRVLADLETTIPREEIPAAIGALEALKAKLFSRLLDPRVSVQANGPDKLLEVDVAAEQLGTSADWLYRNAGKLPFTVRVGRSLRFSEQGIQRYIKTHAGR
jgi:predicted DNA-binding transcriptional regulator AlpA